ncbi:dTDP-4-dehydrorhamnose 3,5-epimerase [Rubellimicrobium sp. CFH 75288]|uniref:dTDP-4-dehydrorhamnose 3,5-epimerase n=1 Tax=Rubellimicrobium sp. CFH 75288 TaxID=2697034 RepID=UPI001412DC0F|nr:dTDP-4-dehydrorhamnose 3,5-epimerase [Rubellimicrobium sp. CFH 75288]
MQIEETALPGVLVLTPRRFADARGWFEETWSRDRMAEAGLPVDWAQDNHSMSRRAGTLRGLHYQAPPRAQAKLVRVLLGAILDVAVDARAGSPHFGRHVAVELSAASGRQLLIPEGFLHGFVTREPDTHVAYKCTDTYAPAQDGAVAWDDPDLAIDWGVADPVLSDKDRAAPRWRDWQTPFAVGSAP